MVSDIIIKNSLKKLRRYGGNMVPIEYDVIVFKEENTYIAYCPELDLSSCGHDVQQAKDMLKTAVRLFVEEAEKMGTLEDILEESKYKKDPTGRWIPPKLVATELVSAF
jgi:predicted RNase H-like HicB family nuclease